MKMQKTGSETETHACHQDKKPIEQISVTKKKVIKLAILGTLSTIYTRMILHILCPRKYFILHFSSTFHPCNVQTASLAEDDDFAR